MEKSRLGGIFRIKCVDKHGALKWEDEAKNLVVNEGLYHILDTEFTGGTPVTTWYIGLANSSPSPAANDTLASHGGWTENSNYTGNRQEWDETRSGATVSNSASKASFPITSDSQTLGGAFLCSVATGTSGTLMSVAAFSGGDKSADNGDTIEVQYDFTAADDGA